MKTKDLFTLIKTVFFFFINHTEGRNERKKSCKVIKKELRHSTFPVTFAKCLRTTFL